jgi:hypothetical protein
MEPASESRVGPGVNCPVFINPGERPMNGIIYLVGLVVVVMAILSFIGIH